MMKHSVSKLQHLFLFSMLEKFQLNDLHETVTKPSFNESSLFLTIINSCVLIQNTNKEQLMITHHSRYSNKKKGGR
jgi:hypothetical protein